jgi:hypothetical protein
MSTNTGALALNLSKLLGFSLHPTTAIRQTKERINKFLKTVIFSYSR